MNSGQKHPTIICSWMLPLLETLEECGQTPGELLKEAGIDAAKIANPDARIPVDKMNTLWEKAVTVTGNDCLGLVASKNVRPTTFHALGFALMVSNNLIDAFRRLYRFYRLISDTIELELKSIDNQFVVSMNINRSKPNPAKEAVDMAMATIVTFTNNLLNSDIVPQKVEFKRSAPKDISEYSNVFQAPVTFEHKTNRIFYKLNEVNLKLPSANTEVARCNDNIVIDYLANFDKENISNQVHAKIIELLPMGEPSIEKLAKEMGISPRSLHRSLKKENASYRAILEDIRKHLAIEYLKKQKYSIIEVAFQLGYSDSGNFTRAFKRWYNVSPTRFREVEGGNA